MYALLNHSIRSFTLLCMLGVGLFSSSLVLAQDEEALFPFRENGLWGYMNTEQEVVVEPQYSEAGPFYNGFAKVNEDTLANLKGETFYCNLKNIKLSPSTSYRVNKDDMTIIPSNKPIPEVTIGKYIFRCKDDPIDTLKLSSDNTESPDPVYQNYHCISDSSINFTFKQLIKICNPDTENYYILHKINPTQTTLQKGKHKNSSTLGGNVIVNENLETIFESTAYGGINGTNEYFYEKTKDKHIYYNWNFEKINTIHHNSRDNFSKRIIANGRYLITSTRAQSTVFDCFKNKTLFTTNNKFKSLDKSTPPLYYRSPIYHNGFWLINRQGYHEVHNGFRSGNPPEVLFLINEEYQETHSIPFSRASNIHPINKKALIHSKEYYEVLDNNGQLLVRHLNEGKNTYNVGDKYVSLNKKGKPISIEKSTYLVRHENYLLTTNINNKRTSIHNLNGKLLASLENGPYSFKRVINNHTFLYGRYAFSVKLNKNKLGKSKYKSLKKKLYSKAIYTIIDSINKKEHYRNVINLGHNRRGDEKLMHLSEAYSLVKQHTDKCGKLYWEGYITDELKVLLDEEYKTICFKKLTYIEEDNIDWHLNNTCDIPYTVRQKPQRYRDYKFLILEASLSQSSDYEQLMFYKMSSQDSLLEVKLQKYIPDFTTLSETYDIEVFFNPEKSKDYITFNSINYKSSSRTSTAYSHIIGYLRKTEKSNFLSIVRHIETNKIFIYKKPGELKPINVSDILKYSFMTKSGQPYYKSLAEGNLILYNSENSYGLKNSKTGKIIVPARYSEIIYKHGYFHGTVSPKYAYILPDQSIWWAEEGFRLNLED